MEEPSLEHVLQRSMCYLRSIGRPDTISLHEALHRVSHEDEAEHVPLRVLRPSVASTPIEIAASYLQATSYLFPILHAFAYALCSLVAHAAERTPVYLFMRDALVIWPCIQAIGAIPATQVRFLFFTRDDAQSGRAPLIVDAHWNEERLERIPRGLLVDSGLYGTLVYNLMKSGRCDQDASVMFLGSRNPFIAGWLNTVLAADVLRGAPLSEMQDIITLVDTIESLLKPIRKDPESRYDVSDPLSFLCSMSFLWGARRYSIGRTNPASARECVEILKRAKRETNHWLLERHVPRWPEADQFISGWDLGPVHPMNQFCGLEL